MGPRSEYEIANNPIVAGMIETHVSDIVGEDGPGLQIISDDDSQAADQYAQILEEGWREWWAMPDAAGMMSGPDLLQLMVRMLWARGEYVHQIVNDPDAEGKVKMRLNALHPRRLETPPGMASNFDITLGVKRNRVGKPLVYYVDDTPQNEHAASIVRVHTPFDAKNIDHRFRVVEPGQARGVPWMASVLDVIADLRDYDIEVLDKARLSNDWSVALTATGNDVEPMIVNECENVQRGMYTTMPPGWTANMLTPPQPSETYVSYRTERMRDMGRPVNMPLMMVRLDASGHNYSSARFDAQKYNRSNSCIARWISRGSLFMYVNMVEKEMQIAGELPMKRPRGLRHSWTWPSPPHVDPVKEAMAEHLYLIENKSMAFSDALRARGDNIDDFIKKVSRDRKKLEKAGLGDLFQSSQTSIDGEGRNQQFGRALMARWINKQFMEAVEEFGEEIMKENAEAKT